MNLDIRVLWRDLKNSTIRKWCLGFNPSDTWNLDFTISKFVLPRLKYFKDTHRAYPCKLTPENWVRELDVMIAAFEILANEDDYFPTGCMSEEKQKIVTKGLKSFHKHYQNLWW